MKNRILKLFVTALLSSCISPLAADSPLTSTPWHRAYLDLPAVRTAASTFKLTHKLARFLGDRRIPLDRRAALVNALGWHPNGKDNHLRFRKWLQQHRPAWINDAPPDIRLLYAYLQAMDRYQSPGRVVQPAQQALAGLPGSQAAAIVAMLIRSQQLLFSDWTPIWPAARKALTQHYQKDRLRPAALTIISNYMRFYAPHPR